MFSPPMAAFTSMALSWSALPPKTADLEELFRYEVFKMLKEESKINDTVIENMLNWHHSGFNIYCCNAIWPYNEEGLENLARNIIRAPFMNQRTGRYQKPSMLWIGSPS